MSRDLFYFSKGDRRAVIFLVAVIIAINIVRISMLGHGHDNAYVPVVNDSLFLADKPARSSEDSTVRRFVRDTVRTKERSSGREFPTEYSRRRNYSDTLYIVRSETRDDTLQALPDRWVRKVRPAEPVDLNSADTALLKTLPGIGSYYARRIVDYRESLGGYLRAEQILDMGVLPDSLVQWFTVADTLPFRKVKINNASVSEMRSHPYMSFYQARAISDLRKSIGLIKSPARLTLLEEFTGQDLERLIPYLDFD